MHDSNKRRLMRMTVGISLLAFGASHGITGLLANTGWYTFVGVDFDRWYMHPAYQSMCWFANGISVAILAPMWFNAINRKLRNGQTTKAQIEAEATSQFTTPGRTE